MSMDRSEPWHLARKVFLLLLLVVALAFGLVILLDRGPRTPMLMFNLLADGSIGVAMGLGSRFVLRRRHWLIRALVSASLSVLGLIVLGYLTNARSGVGPLALQLQRVHWLDQAGIGLQLPVLPGNSHTDLMDVAHIVIAVNLSWIALRAWGGRVQVREPRYETASWGRAATPAAGPVRMAVAAPAAVSVVRPVTASRSRPVVRARRNGRVVISRGAVARARARGSNVGGRRRGFFRRRLAVQLAAYEEHRCPYCLQDIKRDDLRVECPVCHTLHHKDCWDITGTCQVPHLNG